MPQKRLNNVTLWQMPGVGEVVFKRNSRAKRLTISIRPNAEVKVSLPSLLPLFVAKQFVINKKSWIAEKINEISQRNEGSIIREEYTTRHHRVTLVPANVPRIKTSKSDNCIQISFPQHLSIADKSVQELAIKAIDDAYRKEALQFLPIRVKQLALQYGFKYNDLRIKRIKSRWGSCSAMNNLNLSIYLMKLPDELIDYVILHELTHTIHKNHGIHFWNHLNQLTGNAKTLAARVRKYRTGFHGN